MNQEELKLLFDEQAPNYDNQWKKMAPLRDCLYFFLDTLFSELPLDATVLCVGAGTGNELIYLAERFPHYNFTVVEPSGAMLNVCRDAVEKTGFSSRCQYHEGYLNTLSIEKKHDAATCFLVSQFILDANERSQFFYQIAERLKHNGILVSADLAFDIGSDQYSQLLALWMAVMSNADVTNEIINKIKDAYAKDVSIISPEEVASIINAGGFTSTTPFYQAGLIHAFFSRRN